MQIQPRPATIRNPPEQFTGDVYLDPIAGPQDDGQRMVVGKVRFCPGARTAWHSHARGQTLQVSEGVAWMGTRDGKVLEVHAGQTVYTPPGEEHWHGATATDFMEHLAMLELGDDPATSNLWLEHVSDEQYHGPRP